jgi:hypothetical protein
MWNSLFYVLPAPCTDFQQNRQGCVCSKHEVTNPLKFSCHYMYRQWSLYVPQSGHYMYRTVVTICTAQWSLHLPHSGHYMYRQWSLYVPHSGHYMYRTVVTICNASDHYMYRHWSLYVPRMVTICTTSLTFNNSTFCPHSEFMCFVWISEQTAIISLYNINWLVCITETGSVYCAVRTGCLYNQDGLCIWDK